jgi:hypothetical protein
MTAQAADAAIARREVGGAGSEIQDGFRLHMSTRTERCFMLGSLQNSAL